MAEYVWVNVYRPNSGYVPFFVWTSREDAVRAGEAAGTDLLGTDRYLIKNIEGARCMVYDPEPKYEGRDLELVLCIREQHQVHPHRWVLSNEKASELVAKHRQSEASR